MSRLWSKEKWSRKVSCLLTQEVSSLEIALKAQDVKLHDAEKAVSQMKAGTTA
jgi:hypothetical protein